MQDSWVRAVRGNKGPDDACAADAILQRKQAELDISMYRCTIKQVLLCCLLHGTMALTKQVWRLA
jgi:hypothetical protein